jgi:hypothetical protein
MNPRQRWQRHGVAGRHGGKQTVGLRGLREKTLMAAHPKKVDAEGLLRKMAPPPAPTPACNPPSAEHSAGTWRVVSADGSTIVFDAAAWMDGRGSSPPQAAGPDAHVFDPVAWMAGHGDCKPAEAKSTIDMPTASPALSEMLPAADEVGLGNMPQWGRVVSSPDPHAAVVSAPGGCGDNRFLDAQLARIVAVWPKLPRGIREAILVVINAATD